MNTADRILPAKDAPLPERAELAIIGGGVMGLSIAYQLALLGFTDVVILERSYLASGASGRNGGGIRQQFSTELNIRLMRESVALCKQFAAELGVNIWFRQGGYLFLSRSPAETERLAANIELQNRLGVKTRMIDMNEARDIVPELETSRFHAACYNGTDGILFPWPFLWGYAQAAVARGAKLYTETDVQRIDREAGGGFTLHTSRGKLRTRRVVNAAGAWSPQVARMVGVELPNHPTRHEICSSEPLKPFLRPMVSVIGTGLYFSQSMRGELVGGITLPNEPHTLSMRSTLRFLHAYARGVTEVIPSLGDLKVLRQWAGPYDVTADGNPILGEPAGVPGFFLCCGFMGHGFMMAPIMGKLYAELLVGAGRHEIFERCPLERFASGNLVKEDFIIG